MLAKVLSIGFNRQFLKLNLVLVVLLLLGALSATAQDAITSSPTVVSQAWFPGLSIGDTFAKSLLIIEFPPGGGVPLHTHGGAHVVTVLDGAVTVVEDGVETVYEAGESFTEAAGHIHEAFNAGEVPAHVAATWLLTEGAARTTLEGDGASERPAITVVSQAEYPDLKMDGLFVELVRVLDFAPGAGVPFHSHGGPHLVLVLEGAITVTEEDVETVYEAGESFTEAAGHVHQARNAGDVPARVAATWLLSIAPPTTLQP
jgi:quercetin dioxygenase-like cupin family protein